MYTLNDAKYDCLKEFKSLGLETPNPLWLDFIIKLIVEDFYKQPFLLNGTLADVGLKINEDGDIPINEKFAKDIIVNAVLGVHYSSIDEDKMEEYATTVMIFTKAYNEFLLEGHTNDE